MRNMMTNRIIKRVMSQFGVEEAKRVAAGLVQAAEAAEEARMADDDARIVSWANYVELQLGKGAAVRDGGVLIDVLAFVEVLTKGAYNKELQSKLREIGIKQGLGR